MKERPILFSGEMVRAILEGRKTQTRRIAKPQPEPISFGWVLRGKQGACQWGEHIKNPRCATVLCPYGQPGDELWVKETFRIFGGDEYAYQQHQPSVRYRADAEAVDDVSCRWKPSIFMPRWASRIQLSITSVRVERLNDCSEEDAKAEGVTLKGITRHEREARDAYEALWESINGAGSWAENPWVWVIGFERKDTP